jgi:hypothetical protein
MQQAPTVESYADMTMMSEWNFEDGGADGGGSGGTVKGMTVIGLPGRDSGRPVPPVRDANEQAEQQMSSGLGKVGEGYEEDSKGSFARMEKERLDTIIVVDPAVDPPIESRSADVRSVTPLASAAGRDGRGRVVESDSESVSSTQRYVFNATERNLHLVIY